jgi:hypothetical protein
MFEDIKNGDKVMFPVPVQVGGFERNPERFWMPIEVLSMTPKRFTTESGTYAKSNGENIRAPEPYMGSRASCHLIGSKPDETEQRKVYIRTINARAKVGKMSKSNLNLDQCTRILAISEEG